jgi:hypothetical protein
MIQNHLATSANAIQERRHRDRRPRPCDPHAAADLPPAFLDPEGLEGVIVQVHTVT